MLRAGVEHIREPRELIEEVMYETILKARLQTQRLLPFIAICAADLRHRGRLKADTVVVTVMTNLGFRLAMEQAGVHVVETPVGDRYVLEALVEHGYSLGGEQSGHVIFPEIATTGDGMVTALSMLTTMKQAGRPVRSRLRAYARPHSGRRRRHVPG